MSGSGSDTVDPPRPDREEVASRPNAVQSPSRCVVGQTTATDERQLSWRASLYLPKNVEDHHDQHRRGRISAIHHGAEPLDNGTGVSRAILKTATERKLR